MKSQKEALDALLETAAREKGSTVVLDIDDTILSTAERNLRILREFSAGERVRKAWPREAALLEQTRHEHLKYAIADSARAAGVSLDALIEELHAFWRERFFTNDYLLSDEPVPGAAEYCVALSRAGANLVYMTGRDELMRAGTEASLVRHGFPMKGAVLVLKPRFDTPDIAFKGEALRKLSKVAGTFENEPAHVNLFQAAFPKAHTFFLETKHSGKPVEPHPSAARIKDFRR